MERPTYKVLASLGKETCELMDKLLTLDPRERITASDALDHEYFWSDPLPADPRRSVHHFSTPDEVSGGSFFRTSLPSYEASHEFDQRGRRHQPPVQNEPPVPQNRKLPNDDTARRGVHDGSMQPYGPTSGYNLMGVSLHPSQLPYQHPPVAPPQVLRPPGHRNAGSRAGNVLSGHNGANFGDRRHQTSQLPPRPPGLPLRPEGLSQLPGRRPIAKGGPPLPRGPPGSYGLNYG